MAAIYDAAVQECKYHATRFIQMVRADGGLATARTLLDSDTLSDGLTRLWECGRLDLSLEALILQDEWAPLFTDVERERARMRLKGLGFNVAP